MNYLYRLIKPMKSLTALCCLLFLTNSLLGQVNCPANTTFDTVDCTNIDDVPGPPNNPDDAMAAPYNIEIPGMVSSTRVTSEDSGVIFYCEDDLREVIRTVTVYNDLDFSFSLTDGDEILGTCDFTIPTTPDTEAPVFDPPLDVELSCGIDIDDLSMTGMVAEIIDGFCPVNSISDYAFYADAAAMGDCPNVLIVTRSWTAVDPCGNTSETITQKITLVDTEGPEFTPPPDVTLPCGSDPNDSALTGTVTDAADACDDSMIDVNGIIVPDLTQENTPCPGSTTYVKRWGATDNCGNPNTMDQLIIIECPADCTNTDPCVGDIVTDPLPGECECQVVEAQVLGCTDPSAANYNPDANCDDGSCAGDFDLALRKTLSSAGPFAPGDDVTFTITIFNQGDVVAQNVLITDYLPTGLILNDAAWADQGDGTATITIAGPIAAGADESVTITFTIPSDAGPGSLENIAEITSAEDEDGNPGEDIDSTPDNDPDNDTLVDDEIDNGGGDEDDHDIAVIEIACNDGCTDPTACNYDAAATCDDDSCRPVPTCNDDPCDGDITELSDDSCNCVTVEPQVLGCTDSSACNYNPDANCEDGSCKPFPVCNDNPCRGDVTEEQDCECVVVEPKVTGCDDPNALNYNSAANCNDGSCEYASPCPPKMKVCAGPGSPVEICLPCVLSGEIDATVTNVNITNGNGKITDLADAKTACFSYTPSPSESGMNELVTEYCRQSTGQCWTIIVIVNIDPSCGDGPPPVVCPDELEYCTQPTTPVEICIDCIDQLGYEYTNVYSLFHCAIDDLDDSDQACFTYTPVPLMELYSPDQVIATYCIPGTDECHTTTITVYIQDDCDEDPDDPDPCDVDGGTLTGGPYTFCIGDGEPDYATGITLSGDDGDFSGWVVTDEDGNVLGLPADIEGVDFDTAGSGTCLIWNISYDNVTGLYQGANADDFDGCYDLSNPIEVVRIVCEPGCEAEGGTLTGGPFTFCVGDGTPDYVSDITLSGNSGDNTAWVITDENGEILGLPSMPGVVDFDGAGTGVCLIWSVSFDELVGAYVGANANDLTGCFDLSNSITVNRVECATDCPDVMNFCTTPTTEIEICIPCIADGSFDATIIDVVSLYDCGLDDLDDDNQACFTYTPLPLMQNYSPDLVTVEYCAGGDCHTTEIIMEIKVDCSGVAAINTAPNNFDENLLELQSTELSEKTLQQLELAPVIYPIPSGDFINIALKAEIETADLTIYNSKGQTMHTRVVQNSSGNINTVRLDVSSYESGIYFLLAKFGDSVRATQFIKK